MHIQCIECGEKYPLSEIIYNCKKCGDILDVRYDYEEVSQKLEVSDWKERPLAVWKYRELLPVLDHSKIVTLNEGGTSLYRCERLGSELGLKNLYVKNEGENPTGSFKDRGMTVGVTKALELHAKTVICASTGNTASSLAAYAAKAGLRCIVLIPSGKIALGKLAQAMMYGAMVIAVKGSFDDALSIVMQASTQFKVYLLNSINPFRLEGQKTAAFEVCNQLGLRTPDRVILPVGNAGNISAYWKGIKEFHTLGVIDALPKMIGVQAAGAPPIARAVKRGLHKIAPVGNPETVATAIRIGNPISWKKALKAIYESKGTAEIVSDKEIIAAQKLLARKEGIFVEPASASSIAGLKKLAEAGELDKNDVIVCVATGHGLKDPDVVMKVCEKPLEIKAELSALKKVLGV